MSEDRYKRYFDEAPQGIFVIDGEGLILEANPAGARITGRAQGDLPGLNVRDLIASEALDRLDEAFARLEQDRRHTATYPAVRPGGEVRECTVRAVPLPDGTILVFMHDQTEQQRLQAQLQSVHKLRSLGLMAGGIAHDFNNLLVSVLGNASLALLELPETSPAFDLMKDVEKAATRAAELCNQMLAYAGRGRFHPAALDLNAVVREMAALASATAPGRGRLHYALSPTPLPVEADPSQVQQILLNLVTNAAEADDRAAGRITIRTFALDADRDRVSRAFVADDLADGPYAVLEVKDRGSGMDAATRERVFDPFFTTRFTGRGLGMSVVLGLVRRHRGAVRVASQPGKGTTVTVLLPQLRGERPAAAVQPAGEDPLSWHAQGTVLVADDEPDIRKVAGDVLARLGFEVLPASDGLEAFDRFRGASARVRLVLLDVTMPRQGGAETLAQIRALAPRVPVVVMSGHPRHAVMAELGHPERVTFLQKPFDIRMLAMTVRTVLQSETGRHAAVAAPPTAREAPPEASDAAVLVADDEADVRREAARCLERLGFRPLLARHGGEALDLFAQHRPAIRAVLLDQLMPVKDGAETYMELHRRAPDLPVVFACPLLDDLVQQALRDHGVAGFITKPYSLEAIREALSEAGVDVAAVLEAAAPTNAGEPSPGKSSR